MAWDRVVELYIGPDPTKTSALLVSGLDIDFKVNRSTTFVDNSAEFTVYNASETTRKTILVEGANVIFKAGYSDSGVGTLFIGNISKATSARAGADWITNIRAVAVRGAAKPLDSTMISVSYAPGANVSDMLSDIATAMGLVLTGVENANIALANGLAFAGRVRDALGMCATILKSQSVGVYMDNGEIVVYKAGEQSSKFSIAYLSYNSGLLSVKDTTEEQDLGFVAKARKAGAIVSGEQMSPEEGKKAIPTKRVEFSALLIPKLQPNSVIKIDTSTVNGSYIVDTLEFKGNNYGGDFGCSGEASAPI